MQNWENFMLLGLEVSRNRTANCTKTAKPKPQDPHGAVYTFIESAIADAVWFLPESAPIRTMLTPSWDEFKSNEKEAKSVPTLKICATLESVINKLGVKKVSLVVEGYFAPIVVKYATKNQNKLNDLILLNPPIHYTSQVATFNFLFPMVKETVAWLDYDGVEDFCKASKHQLVELPRLAIELARLVVNWEKQRQNEMKIVNDCDGSSQNNDVSSITSNGADPSVQKDVTDPFNLVRVLQRLACDLASAPGSFARQGQRTDPDSTVSSSHQGANVGVVISNLKYVMKLIGGRVMLVPDFKKSITQILNSLLSEKGTDHTVLLCILDVIKGWIDKDFGMPGMNTVSVSFLTPKEVVSFLQKLSQLDKQNFSRLLLKSGIKSTLSSSMACVKMRISKHYINIS
ncbi:hypothetical protein Tco_1188943 [Tanacetum coccineum]